jgi:hypothetical protein
VGFDLGCLGFVNDTGFGVFLRRHGQAQERFKRVNAMFYYHERFKYPVGSLWL